MNSIMLQHTCEYCLALEQDSLPMGGSFISNHLKKVVIKYVKGHNKLVEELLKKLRENAKSIEELSIEELEPDAENLEGTEPNAEVNVGEVEASG